jgi:hypothetical protein
MMASTIGPVDANSRWSLPSPASPGAWYINSIKHLPDVVRIAALSGGDKNGQGQIISIYA